MPVQRPSYDSVPFQTGLRWDRADWLYQEKKDGVWREREVGGDTLVGEEMPDGVFWPFDIVAAAGQDVTRALLDERVGILADAVRRHSLPVIPSGFGGEFLRLVVARGGEGVVAKHLGSPFGHNWVKCKATSTEDCVVLERHRFKRSVRVGQLAGGSMVERGWFRVPETVVVGDVIEVECQGLTVHGQFREPRFSRPRPDKSALTSSAVVCPTSQGGTRAGSLVFCASTCA